jgi:drug/metabolite transporter (DMT)-like permease
MHQQKRPLSIIIGLSVAFLWSTSWVLIKYGLKDMPALPFAGIRNSIATLCLLPFLFLQKRRTDRPLSSRLWLRLVALGLLLYAGTQGALFLALTYLPAITVNLIWSFTTIVVALLGLFLLHEQQTILQWVGIAISIVGALLYFYPVVVQSNQLIGVGISAIGLLTNAGAAILGRSINRSKEMSPIVVTTISMAIGSALLLPIGIWLQGFPVISSTGWLIIIWLAVVNTATAFTLWNYVLRVLSATEASMINNTIAVWMPILAVLFLNETLNFRQIAALMLVGVGTLVVQIKRISHKKHVEVID